MKQSTGIRNDSEISLMLCYGEWALGGRDDGRWASLQMKGDLPPLPHHNESWNCYIGVRRIMHLENALLVYGFNTVYATSIGQYVPIG